MSINVNELYAPTIQGEGVHAGQLVGFVRLANCNLACSWCDTPYSWDWERFDKALEVVTVDESELVDIIENWNVPRVVITGGEPLMQQASLVNVMRASYDLDFDIETNGTIAPLPELVDLVDTFVVSPKLSHSGDIFKKRIKENALRAFADLAIEKKAIFKFVCKTPDDLLEVKSIATDYDIPQHAVWIMPEGTTAHDQLERMQILADAVVSNGFNLSPRLHVMLWGNRRAV